MDHKEFRKRRRMVEKSQREAAKVINLTGPMICYFEAGRITFDKDDLKALEQWLLREEAKLGIIPQQESAS